MKRVSVIGGGVWGVALARAAAHTGARVALFSKRTFEGALPEHVVQVKSFKEAASHARLLVLAVPSTVAHTVAHELGDYIDGSHYVVHGVRGLAEPELATVSEVVRKETAARRVRTHRCVARPRWIPSLTSLTRPTCRLSPQIGTRKRPLRCPHRKARVCLASSSPSARSQPCWAAPGRPRPVAEATGCPSGQLHGPHAGRDDRRTALDVA